MLVSKANAIPGTSEVSLKPVHQLLAGLNGSKIAASAVLLIVGILSFVVPGLAVWLWPFWLGGY